MLSPVLVAVVGTLVYALATNAKVVEIGRAAMWSGMLVSTLVLAGKVIHF